MSQTPRGCSSCFLLVWLLGWTAGTATFDVVLVGALAYQTRALTFASTEGTVTKSAIRTGRDSDGNPSYRLDIAYEYDADGRRHTGTRYSYLEMGTGSKAWHEIRDELPVGARVRVWYNSDDPAEAVLLPGLTGFHASMIWFLTPFNAVMFGGWVFLTRGRAPAFDPNDSRSVESTPSGVRVRLPTLGRFGLFAVTLLGITFAGTFVIGFGFGFNPPLALGGGAYLAAVAVAAAVAARHTTPFVEVNHLEHVVRVVTGREPVEVPFKTVRAVHAVDEESTDSDGDKTHKYHCELILTGTPGEAAPVRFATYNEAEPAERLAAWLRSELELEGS